MCSLSKMLVVRDKGYYLEIDARINTLIFRNYMFDTQLDRRHETMSTNHNIIERESKLRYQHDGIIDLWVR